MSRRLSPRRFHQALKAGLPVQRRAPQPQSADASVCILSYYADGRCVSRQVLAGSQVPDPPDEVFTFTARQFACETDLQYYRVRYHDPSVGRWLSDEPLDSAGGDPNLYRYVATPPGIRARMGEWPAATAAAG